MIKNINPKQFIAITKLAAIAFSAYSIKSLWGVQKNPNLIGLVGQDLQKIKDHWLYYEWLHFLT